MSPTLALAQWCHGGTQNWTSSSSEHSAVVGHHDRFTFNERARRGTRSPVEGVFAGERDRDRRRGLFYCFAAD
jgi:hypothetical protein